MSRIKKIAQYNLYYYNTGDESGTTITTKINWDKNLLQQHDITVHEELEHTEKIAPNFIDQYKLNNVFYNIWADENSSFEPQWTNLTAQGVADGRNYDYTLADSLIIGIHLPVIIGADYLKARGKGSTNDTYEYVLTLDGAGTITNTTGIFEGLPSGAHLLTINDREVGKSTSLIDYEIQIDAVEQYSARWSGSFEDINGGNVSVSINRKGYQGEKEEICFSGNPLTITSDVTGDDFISGVVPSDIQLQLIQTYDDQFNDLFITPADYWTISIDSDSGINMTGLIMPQQTIIEHMDNPIRVNINAVGGLTNMGEEVIEGWTGGMFFIDVIAAIQTEFNILQYKIRDLVGLREDSDPSSYLWETMRRYKISATTFNGLTPKEAINLILNSLGCSMTHASDDYLHVQTVAISTTIGQALQSAIYSPDGVFLNYSPITINAINIKCDRTGDGFYVENSQSYGFLPAIRKFSLISEFSDGETWVMPMDPDDYTVISEDDTASVTLAEDHIRLNGRKDGRLYWLPQRPTASSGGFRVYGYGINLSINYEYLVGSWDSTDLNEYELIDIDTGIICMLGNERCLNNEGDLDFNIGHIFNERPRKANIWDSRKIEASTFTSQGYPQKNGMLKIWLLGLWRNWIADEADFSPLRLEIKNFTVEVKLPENHEQLNIPFEVDLDNEGLNLGDVIVSIGDAPDQYGYGIDIGGVIIKEDNSLTSSWRSYSQNYAMPLNEYLASNITKLRKKNIKQLSGSINSDYPTADKVLYDMTVDGGFFMLQHFTYDVKQHRMNFSALEITAGSGNRLTEDTGGRLTEDLNKRTLQ